MITEAPPAESSTLMKLAKYGAVSAIATPINIVILTVLADFFGWDPVASNVVAVSLSAIPSYFLNRAWVWQVDGVISFRSEVLPFWVLAFLGLVVSTILVKIVTDHTDMTGAAQVANVAGFGVLWVAKFFILDRWLFAAAAKEAEAASGAVAT